ncbi:MAG TPA: 2-oxo acid dehydrogenase subunit E2 [Tissierellia bacterium]|nr:2-oxo acid dehydrogenase subunit E2 [Tissierellia bacterium]
MAKILVMPKLGLTMSEGKVSKWHKKEGDEVKVGDVIFEVETDKLTNEVIADQDGFLRKIIVKEGESAKVAEPVGIIAALDEDISNLGVEFTDEVEDTENREPMKSIEESKPVTKAEGEYIRATPYAKKLARERAVDLSKITGTGIEGRILARDVLTYKEERKVKISPVADKMAVELGVDIDSIKADGRIMKKDILRAIQVDKTPQEALNRTRIIEPNNMRRIIAKRMHESWTISPRVTYNIEVDVTDMKQLRESLKDSFLKEGVKISYNHILMKILSKTLLEFPYLNGSFDGENIILHDYVNLGLAVDVGDGLLVPNVKDIQEKSLLEIAKETEKLIEDARTGRLSPDHLEGGTFTLTNMGMFGIDSFSPIINQPEVAILGVNRIVDKPVILDGEIVVRPMMNLSLTADHRLIDGAMAGRFLARTKAIIENPYLLLMY